MVAGGGGRALLLAGAGENRDFEGRHVAVDAAGLELFLLVDDPAALPGNAETGVVENEDELALGHKMGGGVLEDREGGGHIL